MITLYFFKIPFFSLPTGSCLDTVSSAVWMCLASGLLFFHYQADFNIFFYYSQYIDKANRRLDAAFTLLAWLDNQVGLYHLE